MLEYEWWETFSNVIKKAETAYLNSGLLVEDHFRHVTKMIQLGKGGKRSVEDWQLSRYACYLVVENADPSKPVVTLGQTYFATKAREAEIMDELPRIKTYDQLMDQTRFLKGTAAKVAGIVRARDFSIFQDHGYRGLYNGETAQDIHRRKGLKKSQEITDYMGRIEPAANQFREAQAEAALLTKGITDPNEANEVHFMVGQVIREAMQKAGGIMPEDLPTPTESIQKVKRKRLKRGATMPEFGKPGVEEHKQD